LTATGEESSFFQYTERRRIWRGAAEEGKLNQLTGVKVFSATKARERESLGEKATEWLREHQDVEIIDKIVTQSSDSEFHCLTITIFFRHGAGAATQAA